MVVVGTRRRYDQLSIVGMEILRHGSNVIRGFHLGGDRVQRYIFVAPKSAEWYT